METLTINGYALAACIVVASKETTRYYLNGVNVKRDATGTTYTGCDGLAALFVRDETPEACGLYIDIIVPRIMCATPKKGELEYNKMVLREDGFLEYFGRVARQVEGPYSNVMRLVPEQASRVTATQIQVSPILIGQFSKISDILCEKKGLCPEFLPTDGQDYPMIVRFSGSVGNLGAFGLAMPLRIKNDEPWFRPSWVVIESAE